MEYSIKKINKLKKLINETEDNDEKSLLLNTLAKKLNTQEIAKEIKNNTDPLLKIIEKEKLDVFKHTLENIKINWNKYIFYEKTPLQLAIENGDLKMIELLFYHNHPLWLPNKSNLTPFEIVCLYRDVKLLKYFIDMGVNIKKILYLRDGNKNIKFFHANIDFLVIAKKILIEENNITEIRKNLTNNNRLDIIGLEDFTWQEFHYGFKKFIERDFPNLLGLYQEFKDSKYINDFIYFFFMFDLDFNFEIEDEKYFFLELDYNKNKYDKKLKFKFFNDYKKIYSYGFLDLIWNKWNKKNSNK